MDRAEKMREKRSSIAVKLIKLIKIYSSDPDVVTCVFEGEDAKYYGVRIDGFLKGLDRKNISCKGKNNLIALKEKVELHFDLSNAKVLYFSDRDFDFTDTTNGNIYFTPCYSVENFYVKNSVLKRILVDEFGFCEVEDKNDIAIIIETYDRLLSKISKALLSLNAWILCQNQRHQNDSTIKLNLNNFDVGHFVEFDLESVAKNYDETSLRNTFPNSASISSDEIDTTKNVIIKSGIIESSRGKYMLEFFRMFLEKIREEINKNDSTIINKKMKTKLTISKSNVLSDLSQYAETPSCLTKFLSGNLEIAA